MTHLLISEPPLQVLPSLAVAIGLNEAIFVQQLHYWIISNKAGKYVDERVWIYNTVKGWKETNFPFWSESTIKRTTKSLEKSGIVLSRNDLNKMKIDSTKWYSIDYEMLEKITTGQNDLPSGSKWSDVVGQNDLPTGSKWSDVVGQNDPTNNQRLPETTSKKTNFIRFVTLFNDLPLEKSILQKFSNSFELVNDNAEVLIISTTQKHYEVLAARYTKQFGSISKQMNVRVELIPRD